MALKKTPTGMMKMNTTNRNVTRRVTLALPAALLLTASLVLSPRVVRADEFATVPAGDALYRHLTVVAKTGWSGASGQEPQAAGGTDATLTRYEIALETAKAIVTVTARHEANSAWPASAYKPALRALRELAGALRAELKSLGIDVAAALALCDALLKAPDTGPPAASRATGGASGSAATVRRGVAPSTTSSEAIPRAEPLSLSSLSQRLRVTAALSSVERDAGDPFGDAALGLRAAPSRTGVVSGPRGAGIASGAALGVNGWLTLRAAYGRSPLAPSHLTLQELWSPGAREQRTLGSGLDIALRPGMTLSGGVESIATDAAGRPSWTRVSGGVGLSAWQNRLSLKANLSRLVPEDARVLPSTMAGLNVGLGLGERLSLNLLYQQLFSAPAPARADRLVAGGISVNF